MSDEYLRAVAPIAGDTPRVYGDRIFAFAQRAVIVDPIAFARKAFASLPAEWNQLRSAERRTAARLHVRVAADSFESGWFREARAHARQAMALAPWRIADPRLWKLTADRHSELDGERNLRLRAETLRIARAFRAEAVASRLVGTLAVSLQLGHFLKLHDDIDFVVPTAADLPAALSVLTHSLGYRVTLSYDWLPPGHSEHGSLRKLDHSNGAKVDIAYLPHWPVRAGTPKQVEDVTLPLVDFSDLRNTYAVFLVMNEAETTSAKRQSDRNTIRALDALLGRSQTVAVLATECDRLPAGYPDFPSGS